MLEIVLLVQASAIVAPVQARTANELYIIQRLSFQSAAAQAALTRQYDTKLNAQKKVIQTQQVELDSARAQLRAAGRNNAAAEARIAVLERDLTDQMRSFNEALAAKDTEFATELDRFAAASARIFETPSGAQALELLLVNQPETARQARHLLNLAADREAERDARATAVRNATRRRDIAVTTLDEQYKGNLTIGDAIADWEAVVAADPNTFIDWIRLSELYRAQLRNADAELAAGKAVETAQNDLDRASALLEVGAVLFNQGKLDAALDRYRQGIEIQERLVSLDPDSADKQNHLSFSHQSMGDVFYAQQKWKDAQSEYEKSLAIAERAVSLDPASFFVQRHLTFKLDRIGDVMLAQRDYDAAMVQYERSIAIKKAWLESDPSVAMYQRDLSISISRLGDIAFLRNRFDEAVEHSEQAVALSENLAKADPLLVVNQSNLRLILSKTAEVHEKRGDFVAARLRLEQALAAGERMVKLAPNSTQAQAGLGTSLLRLGDFLQARNELDGAFERYQQGLVIFERIAVSNPDSTDEQMTLLFYLRKVAPMMAERKDFEGARKLFERSVLVAENLVRMAPTSMEAQSDLGQAIIGFGDFLQERNDLEGAIERYQQALAIQEKLAQLKPDSANEQRLVWAILKELAELKVPGFTWQRAFQWQEAMAAKNMLLSSDAEAHAKVKQRASEEAAPK